MELSPAHPVPTSVRFYLAALLSNSAGREICRCIFFSLYSNRCIKLSWAKQQTGVSDVRKEKCFVRETRAFWQSGFCANCFRQKHFFFFFLFWISPENPHGNKKKTFQICVVLDNWNTNTEEFFFTLVFLAQMAKYAARELKPCMILSLLHV